ncbi:Mucin-12 [Xylographa bjoerkii]|nr:Mucin-12 [Xylographa bjoerkii]
MSHHRYLASMIRTICLFVYFSTAAYAVAPLTESSIAPTITSADTLPISTASEATGKCTPSIVTLSGALFLVDEPTDDHNAWPLPFTETSTHFCHIEEVTAIILPHADNQTTSPILATSTISEAILPNTTSPILSSLFVEPDDDVDKKRTTTTLFIHVPQTTHRGAAAALSPTTQGSLFTFAFFVTTSLLGQWSVMPVALLALSHGVNSETIAPDKSRVLISSDAGADIAQAMNAERGMAAGQSAITAQLFTSTITISNIVTTTIISKATAATVPRSTDPVVDEGAAVVAAGGALITIGAASAAAPPVSPSTQTPCVSLATFIAATVLGPWGMLPVALILLGLGVNGESFPADQDWELLNPEARNEIVSPKGAKRGIEFGTGVTTTASIIPSTLTLHRHELLTLTTSIMPSAPTETLCICAPCSCPPVLAWEISALVFGIIVGIQIAWVILNWLGCYAIALAVFLGLICG